MDRQTICFPHGTHGVLQSGDQGFTDEVDRLYPQAESKALESLIALKTRLRTVSTDDFWSVITERMSVILGAEMSFVVKRVLVDDHDSAVEMPPIGTPGSCLMATAFHYCDKDGTRSTIKQSRFAGYDCPCAYMRHDKVFLVPENFNKFFTNNPNKIAMPAEAYIAVPLFAEGKCFAHFGVMWSKESTAQRNLSWPFIEALLHSLEDVILERLIQGSSFSMPSPAPERRSVIPHHAVTAAQSLRPYAGSLSHELRTPMQGVVGMLDVMYSTVQEAVGMQNHSSQRRVFEELMKNIEVVQDSCRRVVEAADNVVHAYDMDMSVPEPSPYLLDDLDNASPFSAAPADMRPEIFVAGSNPPLSRKRRRDEAFSRQNSNASNGTKYQKTEGAQSAWPRDLNPSQELREGVRQAAQVKAQEQEDANPADAPTTEDVELAAEPTYPPSRNNAPGLRHTNMREVFQYVINEGLKLGGRPDSALAKESPHGETIEVQCKTSDGTAVTKWVEWSVDPSIPTTLFTDEKDLSKLISCVFLNAIKFTDQDGGRVGMYARMSSRGRYISIKVADNGPGIPAAFLPRLFKAFSQQNGSITRLSEGLGLGLMVAQGISRRLGGDLICSRAVTEGPDHGSEFEIKIPIKAGETISRPSSPFGSPMPRRATLARLDVPTTPPPGLTVTSAQDSPTTLSRALHEAINKGSISCDGFPQTPPTPPTPKSYLRSMIAEPPVTITSSPPTPPNGAVSHPRIRKSTSNPEIDRELAKKYPLTFLVAEDNQLNRKLLVTMLGKLGYNAIHEAYDGAEAVRQMKRARKDRIDVVLMDLWMPVMDGYEATEHILLDGIVGERKPTVLAVTADVTDGALEKAARVGMKGFMSKPYKMHDLQRLITEYAARRNAENSGFERFVR